MTDAIDESPAPWLQLGAVVLRPHRWGDLEDVVASCRDEETLRWTLMPTPYAQQDAIDYLRRVLNSEVDVESRWAICTVDDERFQGNLGLIPDGAGGARVGYYVSPWARGRGLGTGALWLACNWGFGSAGLSVIQWDAIVGNGPSRRMAERVGFRIHSDVARLAIVQRGTRHDAWVGDLLPEDLVPADELT